MKALLFLAAALPLAAQGVWENRSPFPLSATEVSSAAIGSKVYTLCGLTAEGSSRALFVYDTTQDTWARLADMPIEGGADHCNVAAVNGRIYLLGAIRIGSDFVDGNSYEYDPSANRWQQVGRMNYPRGASGVAVIGQKIYVAGGLPGSTSRVESFDPVTRVWAILTDMPTARDHLTAQTVNGRMYATGGRSSADVNSNEEYDPVANSWRTRAPMPTARGGLASGVLAERILVFGGEGNSGTPESTFRQNEEYNPATNTWRTLTPLPRGRHGFYGASTGNRIFAPSGGPVAGSSFSNENTAFVLPPTETPATNNTAIVNSASFTGPLAPGMLVSLFGTGLSQGELVAPRLPLPTSLNSTTVQVNGAAVPIIYAGPGQVNFVLPETLVSGAASIIVNNAGTPSAPVTVTIIDRYPAIFTLNQSGAGQGAILIAGSGMIARAGTDGASRPARRGEVVEIYGTGLGRTSNSTVEAPLVAIGSARADVLYAGLAPGFVGLYQVNVRVPADSLTGSSVPVTWQIGNVVSNIATLAVE